MSNQSMSGSDLDDQNEDINQPNYDNLVTACTNAGNNLQQLGQELGKFGNLSRVNVGQQMQRILDSLRELRDKIDEGYTRQAATERNNRARIKNTFKHDASLPLAILVHPNTGQIIPNFPATLGALNSLNSATITQILILLGIPAAQIPNNTFEKRILLKEEIGVMPS